MFRTMPLSLKGGVIHDFAYHLPKRKCPHMGLLNLTPAGQCTHLCAYCYARGYRWSIHPEETGAVIYYENIAEKLEQELSRITLCPPLYLAATTDVFQPVDEIIRSTLNVVRTIVKHRVSFHIVTRSEFVRKILEMPGFDEYPYFFLEMSVETSDDEKRRILSPNSTPIRDRLETLRLFSSRGFYTVMRIDPIIFGYSEDISQVIELIRAAKRIGCRHIIASTTRFDAIGLQAVRDRLVNEGMGETYRRIRDSYVHEEGWLRVPRKRREEYHLRLRTETEKLGMTYAVCMELDKSFDSASIPHCEGSPNSYMMLRTREGGFRPICRADCIRSCPNPGEPPCTKPRLAVEYPYQKRSLYTRGELSVQATLDPT